MRFKAQGAVFGGTCIQSRKGPKAFWDVGRAQKCLSENFGVPFSGLLAGGPLRACVKAGLPSRIRPQPPRHPKDPKVEAPGLLEREGHRYLSWCHKS